MALMKYASTPITRENFVAREEALGSSEISNKFSETVAKLKAFAASNDVVAPVKSDDFLYFRAEMMSAAERCNIDLATGNVIGDASFSLEKSAEGDDIWKWNGGEANTQPYSNQNGDIFPESELKKAHKGFIGRGLFVNHASDDAEKIRGIIIDTVYDPKFKKLEGLIALDKKTYPDLARQIEMGYQTGVSMGTQVQASYCTLCGNKAIVEADFCDCIKHSKNKIISGTYVGEVNVGLNPIELSIVSVPADSSARIREIYAQLRKVAGAVSDSKNEELKSNYNEIINTETSNNSFSIEDVKGIVASILRDDSVRGSEVDTNVKATLADLNNQLDKLRTSVNGIKNNSGGLQMNDIRERALARRKAVKAYMQGTEEPTTYPVDNLQYQLRDSGDKHMQAQDIPGYSADSALKTKLQRASLEERRDRRGKLLAYVQGTEEPHPPVQYAPDSNPSQEKIRDTEDKHMLAKDEDHLAKDLPLKTKIQRADSNSDKLVARFAHSYDGAGRVDQKNCKWVVALDSDVMFEATADEIYGEDLGKVACNQDGTTDSSGRTYWAFLSSPEYGQSLLRNIQADGLEKVMIRVKGADAFNDSGLGANLGGPEPSVDDGGGVDINIDADGSDGLEGLEGEEDLGGGAETALTDIARILEDEGLVQLLGDEGMGELEGAESELTQIEEGLTDDKLASSDDFKKIVREAIADANALVSAITKRASEGTQATPDPLQATADQSLTPAQPAGTSEGNDSEENDMAATAKEGDGHTVPTNEEDINDMVTAEKIAERKAARQALADLASADRSSLLHSSEGLGQLNNSGSTDTGADTTVEGLAEAQDADLAAARSVPTGKQGSADTRTVEGEASIVDEVNAEVTSPEAKEAEYEARWLAAWNLAVDMRRKGLVATDDGITTQAKKFMSLDEAGFDNMKQIVADVTTPESNDMTKEASADNLPVPPIGSVESSLGNSQDNVTPSLQNRLGGIPWS